MSFVAASSRRLPRWYCLSLVLLENGVKAVEDGLVDRLSSDRVKELYKDSAIDVNVTCDAVEEATCHHHSCPYVCSCDVDDVDDPARRDRVLRHCYTLESGAEGLTVNDIARNERERIESYVLHIFLSETFIRLHILLVHEVAQIQVDNVLHIDDDALCGYRADVLVRRIHRSRLPGQ